MSFNRGIGFQSLKSSTFFRSSSPIKLTFLVKPSAGLSPYIRTLQSEIALKAVNFFACPMRHSSFSTSRIFPTISEQTRNISYNQLCELLGVSVLVSFLDSAATPWQRDKTYLPFLPSSRSQRLRSPDS